MTAAIDLLDDDERGRLRRAEGIGFREPMLAVLTDARFSDEGWLFERKLDGVRVLPARDGGDTVLWSRNRKQTTDTYPELAEALDAHGPSRFVADGEIVAFEGAQTSFARLQQRIHIADRDRALRTGVAVYLYLFDLLVLGDVDLTQLPLRTRKRLLREIVDFTDPIRYSAHRNADGEAYLAQACRRGWEGLIAKRAGSRYRPGRSRDWLKFTCVRGQEFVIGGFTDPAGSRTGFGALLVGHYDGGVLRYAGKVGTGYDTRTLSGLRRRLDTLVRDASPFADRVRERGVHWVEPELVAQIGFTEWTSDGMLRHPRYQGLRTDKVPTDVVREEG
ncbi:MAG: non-homologous end-joining DNA ligase [Pseudonocardiaceae bacterium]